MDVLGPPTPVWTTEWLSPLGQYPLRSRQWAWKPAHGWMITGEYILHQRVSEGGLTAYTTTVVWETEPPWPPRSTGKEKMHEAL